MLKKENPASKMRCRLLDKCSEKGLSYHTIAIMTKCMDGKTESEKEELASQLLTIISESNSEEEIIQKSTKLTLTISTAF